MSDLDPHRETLYEWENHWPGWHSNLIPLSACRKFIWTACDHFGVKRPVVVSHTQGGLSWSMPRANRISMQGGVYGLAGGLNIPTALHEAAHHIAWHIHGETIQDHGPTFLSIFIDLLVRAKVAPEQALKSSARKAGLRWSVRARTA